MIVRAISVFVKQDCMEEFKAATLKNHYSSTQEPGVLRFDVLQSAQDPSEFLLYEVYQDEAATMAHKETPHYAIWKEAVASMMAKDRTSAAYDPVAPLTKAEWRSTQPLQS